MTDQQILLRLRWYGLGWSENKALSSWVGVREVVNGRVTKLILDNMMLTGSIPKGLGLLENLQALWLSNNKLTGSIPSELGQLVNLEELWLSSNNLEGSIPPELGNLTNLVHLDLSSSFFGYLRGSIPKGLGRLKKLETLRLYNNKLDGSIPAELGQLQNLQGLYLNQNLLDGSIPPELGCLKNLRELELSQNRLTGSVPKELGQLQNLIRLRLDNNLLSGEVLAALGDLPILSNLGLQGNQLTAAPTKLLATRSEVEAWQQGWAKRELHEPAHRRISSELERWLKNAALFGADSAHTFAERLRGEHIESAEALQVLPPKRVLEMAQKVGIMGALLDLFTEALYGVARKEAATGAMGVWLVTDPLKCSPKDAGMWAWWLQMNDLWSPQDILMVRPEELQQVLEAMQMPLGLRTRIARAVAAEQTAEAAAEPDCERKRAEAAADEERQRASQANTSSSVGSLRMYEEVLRWTPCGGQSFITRARHARNMRPVVIKAYPTENARAYDREIAALKYLQHTEVVVPLEDHFCEGEHCYIVVRCGDKDLRELIRGLGRDLSDGERRNAVLGFAGSAARALEGIHRAGIVWGDLKPENYVRLNDGLVAIDFEACAKEADMQADDRLCHVPAHFSPHPDDQQNFTWSYCAPERALHVRNRTDCPARPELDVWGLGMLLYWLATGKDYFYGIDVADVERELCSDAFMPSLDRVPRGPWRKAVALALKSDPRARGTASDVRRALTGESHSVLTTSRVVDSQRETLELLRMLAGMMSETLEGELECPKLFLLLEERSGYGNAILPKPSRWFNESMWLTFVCAYEPHPHPVACGPEGKGFQVLQPKKWAKEWGPVLQMTLTVVTIAAMGGLSAASLGATSYIPLPDLKIIEEAYAFLDDTVNEAYDSKGLAGLREVTDASYQGLVKYLNQKHMSPSCCWKNELGLVRATTRGGAVAYVCAAHKDAWKASGHVPASMRSPPQLPPPKPPRRTSGAPAWDASNGEPPPAMPPPLPPPEALLSRLCGEGIKLTKHDHRGRSVRRVLRSWDDGLSIGWSDEKRFSLARVRLHGLSVEVEAMCATDLIALSLQCLECRKGTDSDPNGGTGTKILRGAGKKQWSLGCSFSLVMPERTLDFTCGSREECEELVRGFRALLAQRARRR